MRSISSNLEDFCDVVEHMDKRSQFYQEIQVQLLDDKVRLLQDNILDVQKQHDELNVPGGPFGVSQWIESYSISTLKDSLNMDHGKERKILSIKDLNEKSKLRRCHENLMQKHEVALHALKSAHADLLLTKIEKILKATEPE